jgi:RnfABCDGE-type electron transport complex G subunit
MVGVDTQYKIQGLKILSQNETPGLGTRITEIKSNKTIWDIFKGKKVKEPKEPWFQKQFSEKSLDKIDVITGATISSKAVINTVKDAVEKFKSEEIG